MGGKSTGIRSRFQLISVVFWSDGGLNTKQEEIFNKSAIAAECCEIPYQIQQIWKVKAIEITWSSALLPIMCLLVVGSIAFPGIQLHSLR